MWKTLTLPGKENVMYLKNVSQTPDMFAYTDDDDDDDENMNSQCNLHTIVLQSDLTVCSFDE